VPLDHSIRLQIALRADTVDTLEPAVDMICQTVNSATTATDVIVSKNATAITTAAGLANMTFTHHQLNCADIGTANASTDYLTFDASGNVAGIEEGTSASLTAAQVTSFLGGTPNTNGMLIQAYVLSGHTYLVFNRAKGTGTGSVHLYY
jgi:hypothetical protein